MTHEAIAHDLSEVMGAVIEEMRKCVLNRRPDEFERWSSGLRDAAAALYDLTGGED